MKVLKKLCAVVLSGCLFLCGSGFSNDYEDIQIIELKSNPTTEYSWNVKTIDLGLENTGKVDIVQTDKRDNEYDSICGAGGIDIFAIKGLKKGTVKLEFLFVKNDNGFKRVDTNKTIWATLRVNESRQVKIVNFYRYSF